MRHRIDPEITELYPCFYGGGGSCAFDRRKFLELGGFDELLAPFYLEDTDLGYLAWKRGWKVLYQPASVVYHEHRGTIGSSSATQYIQSVLKKNFLLFTWKNIHEWRKLFAHFFFRVGRRDAELAVRRFAGARQLRGNRARDAAASRERWHPRLRARRLAAISDTEAFRRPLGGHFRDALRSQMNRRNDCACCLSRRIRSVRRCTAAACSCIRRCASWRGCANCT